MPQKDNKYYARQATMRSYAMRVKLGLYRNIDYKGTFDYEAVAKSVPYPGDNQSWGKLYEAFEEAWEKYDGPNQNA